MIPRGSVENSEKDAKSQTCAAPGAAIIADSPPIDPDLQTIIERWSNLPDALKVGIVAMVETSE